MKSTVTVNLLKPQSAKLGFPVFHELNLNLVILVGSQLRFEYENECAVYL